MRRASSSDCSLLSCADAKAYPGSCICSEAIRTETAFLLSTSALYKRPVPVTSPAAAAADAAHEAGHQLPSAARIRMRSRRRVVRHHDRPPFADAP